MSQKTILALVEALRVAGQMSHLINCNKHGSRPPWDHCSCIASDHNAAVDTAAKALRAEIEKQPWEQFPLKNPQEILHIPEVP